MAQHSPFEQYLLELVNRARLDPLAEAARYGIDLNQGLASGTISGAAKQPLAGNTDLAQASEAHSEWMLANNRFSHYGPGGNTPGDRMADAGYDFTGSWTWGENISWRGTTGTVNLKAFVDSQHAGLFNSSGHRKNMLNDYFREAGMGVETGNFNGYNAVLTTEGFAKSGSAVFLTGVVFNDGNGDAFYQPGEGLGGVSVQGLSQTVRTASAGGYEAKVSAGTEYDVTISGAKVSLTMPSGNAKLDLYDPGSFASSVSIKLGAGAVNGKLLGVANLDISGNGAANTLVGNRGNNDITGGDGADTMTGGGGKDTFVLVAGQVNGDKITDFSSNDYLRFEGYHSQANLSVNGNVGQIKLGGDVIEQFTISGNVGSNNYGFFDSDNTGSPPPTPTPDDPPAPDPDPDTPPADPPSTPPGPTNDPDAITGTNAGETLKGTSAGETIRGLGGRDRLVGKSGNDTLDGGAGADTLIGGNGNDVLIMNNGDSGKGGSGADTHQVSLGNGETALIRGFSVSSDEVLLDIGFAVDSAFYQRTEVDGDGKNNDMAVVLQGRQDQDAVLVFEDRYGALRNDAGLSNSTFANDAEVALPGGFDNFVANQDWIDIA